MKAWLTRIQAWRSRRAQRRDERALELWARERADGKKRIVIRSALTYGLTMIGLVDVNHHFFGGSQSDICLAAVFWPVAGICIGFYEWSYWEGKYQKALNESHLKALPENKNSLTSRP